MSGRIRTLKPEILEDAVTAGLSDMAFRLFVATVLLADDYGRLRAEPTWLMGQIYWARKVDHDDFLNAMGELSSPATGAQPLVTFYEVNGQRYAEIRNWSKHQKVSHKGKPRIPPPPDSPPETLRRVSGDPPEDLAKPSGDPPESLRTDHRPTTSDQRPRITDQRPATEAPPEPDEPPESGPLVEMGTARCQAACERYLAALSEAGVRRVPIRERWERQAICDAVSVHLDDGDGIQPALVRLHEAVGEWVESQRSAPQYTSGWSARKFGEWLATRESVVVPEESRPRRKPLPPLPPDEPAEPMTDDERAFLNKLIAEGGRSPLLLEILEDDRNHVVPQVPRILGVDVPGDRGAA